MFLVLAFLLRLQRSAVITEAVELDSCCVAGCDYRCCNGPPLFSMAMFLGVASILGLIVRA